MRSFSRRHGSVGKASVTLGTLPLGGARHAVLGQGLTLSERVSRLSAPMGRPATVEMLLSLFS